MTIEEIKTLYSTCVEEHTEDVLRKALKTVNPTLYGIFITYCADNNVNVVDALYAFWENNAPHQNTPTEGLTLAICNGKRPVRLTYTAVEAPDDFTAAVYNGLTLFSGKQLDTALLHKNIENTDLSAYKQFWQAVEDDLTKSQVWNTFTVTLDKVITAAMPPKSSLGVLCNYRVQDKYVTGILSAKLVDKHVVFQRTCSENIKRFLKQDENIIDTPTALTDAAGRLTASTYRALSDYTTDVFVTPITQVDIPDFFSTTVSCDSICYMPVYQACRCAGIAVEIEDVDETDGKCEPVVYVSKNVNAVTAARSIFQYYVYLAYKSNDINTLAMFDGDPDAIQRVIDRLSQTLLLYYSVTYVDNNDISVEAYLHSRNKGTPFSAFLARKNGEDTNAQRYYRTSVERLLCSPDRWNVGKLTFTLHGDKVTYFTQTDFGYKANHRRYENKKLVLGTGENDGPLLGRTIDGSDFCPGDWLSNSYIGLAIFAGSRSGKGVLTNNIISTLLATGSGVIYIDSKPEQARAIWGFERYYNERTQATPMKLLAVDWNSPIAQYGTVDFDTLIAERKQAELDALDPASETYAEEVTAIETRYNTGADAGADIPTHGCPYTTANIPAFFNEQWFIDYCNRVGASKICTPAFFNAVRVLKLIHLIVSDGLIRAGIPNDKSVGPLYGGKIDLNRYGYVVWDELQKTTGTYGPLLAQLYPLVKALEADIKKQSEKATTQGPTLSQLKTAYRYISRVHRLYNIYNANGTGDGANVVKSELISGFSDFNTYAKTSNIKFIFISQNAPQKTNIPYPAGLYALFQACGLIVGRNGYIGRTNDFAYDKDVPYAKLVNGSVAAVCPSAGDVSVSGYFTYRANGDASSAKVFKSYLTLLENDLAPTICPADIDLIVNFRQDTRKQFIDTNGGCCGLGDGSGVVINTIGRIPQDARASVIKNDCYKADGTRNEELGFIGSTYALMEMAARNAGKTLEDLTADINKYYDELLFVVNTNIQMSAQTNIDVYTSIEAYIGDMGYESLMSYSQYRLHTPTDALEEADVADTSNDSVQSVSTTGVSFRYDNEVDNVVDVETDVTDLENDATDRSDDVDIIDDDSELTQTETQDMRTAQAQTTATNTATKPAPRINTMPRAITAPPAVVPTPSDEDVYTDVDDYTKQVFIKAAEHGITDKLSTRQQLTEFLRRCIKSFVNDDYTLITSVKIDDTGHLYINDTLIRPEIKGLGQNIAPAIRKRLERGCWGDLYCGNSLYPYTQLRILDIATDRVTTFAHELGVNEIGQILKPSYKNRHFPMLEHLRISGSEYAPKTAQFASLADKLSGIIDADVPASNRISNAATSLWRNCRPLRFVTKVFGYSAGLKLAWAGAALMGPIGLAVAGIGTAALAFTEYDSYKQSRASNKPAVTTKRQNTQVVDTTYKPVTDETEKPKQTKYKRKK